MAATDGSADPVEVIDDGPEAVEPGGVERAFAPLPAPDVEVDPDGEVDESAREQSQQAQQ